MDWYCDMICDIRITFFKHHYSHFHRKAYFIVVAKTVQINFPFNLFSAFSYYLPHGEGLRSMSDSQPSLNKSEEHCGSLMLRIYCKNYQNFESSSYILTSLVFCIPWFVFIVSTQVSLFFLFMMMLDLQDSCIDVMRSHIIQWIIQKEIFPSGNFIYKLFLNWNMYKYMIKNESPNEMKINFEGFFFVIYLFFWSDMSCSYPCLYDNIWSNNDQKVVLQFWLILFYS